MSPQYPSRSSMAIRCSKCRIFASVRARSRSRKIWSCAALQGRARSKSMPSAGSSATSPVLPESRGRTQSPVSTWRCRSSSLAAAVRSRASRAYCSTRTGDILALVSSPSFDPLPFSTGLTSAMWRELANDPRKPLSNKVIAGVYPPGSTFKPVVASAALTAGVLTPQTSFTCPGYLQFGNATFHCWRHGGHGTLRLHDAIKKSCDVFFCETARRVGIDRLAAMARRFGFGDLVGIDIPGERPGLIPTREWRLATSGANWTQGETLIAGIGQGSVLATPLQLATMVARLVTGRAVTPRLVRPEGLMRPGGTPAPDF